MTRLYLVAQATAKDDSFYNPPAYVVVPVDDVYLNEIAEEQAALDRMPSRVHQAIFEDEGAFFIKYNAADQLGFADLFRHVDNDRWVITDHNLSKARCTDAGVVVGEITALAHTLFYKRGALRWQAAPCEDGEASSVLVPLADLRERCRKGSTMDDRLKDLAKKYAQDSSRCPYCGSPRIVGERLEVDGEAAHAEVSCLSCGNSWQDVYTLTGVVFLDRDVAVYPLTGGANG